MAKDTIKQRIAKLRASRPNIHTTGMLYRTKAELKKRYHKVTMWTLFRSDENTFMLRPHLFESKKHPRTPAEWREWFATHHSKIIEESIIPGINNRTGKFWQQHTIIGWIPGAATKFVNPVSPKRRRKTNRKRS